MKIGDAFEIVYDLAMQNSIDVHDVLDEGPELTKEALRQQEALNMFHDWVINNLDEEDYEE